MKITLYTPDGTAETFKDCVLGSSGYEPSVIAFAGTDYLGKRREINTNLRFLIDINEAYSLTANTVPTDAAIAVAVAVREVIASDVFETSPLVQDNIPRVQ